MRFWPYVSIVIFFGMLWTCCTAAAKQKCKLRSDNVPEGRKCRKPCKTNKDCEGKSKTCNCDDICGLSCFNPDAECNELGVIENGSVKTSKNNTYNSVAKYTCKKGFLLQGSPERKCQSDKQWSSKEPKCVESACKFPPTLDSAFADIGHDQGHFKVKDVVTYKCRYGYTLSGNPNITCQSDRTWSPARFLCVKISCGKPETPLNGYVEAEDFLFGSWATYKCNKGYQIAVPTGARRHCSTTETWSGEPSVCEIKSCPPPVAPKNGDVEYSSLTYGSIVRYSCDQGYRLNGNGEGLCDDQESWGDLPVCEVDINCKFESADRPLCGYTNEGSGLWRREFLENNKDELPTYTVTFSGERGYAVLRSPKIPDGKPHCLKFYYFTGGDLAWNDLFVKINGKKEKNLAPEGAEIPKQRWVGYQASLIPANNEITIEIVFEGNTQIWIDDLQVDKGQCEAQCKQSTLCKNDGICVDEIGTFYCSCTQYYRGRTCNTEITCEKPDLRFGSVRGPNRLIYGSLLTFMCNTGYERRGPSFATCTRYGLSETPPECVEIVIYDGECPRHFRSYQMMCYRFFTDSKSYVDAQKTCHSHGAELATVQSKGVNKFLFDKSPTNWPQTRYFWVGLRSVNFEQSWESGFTYEGGEGVDFKLTNIRRDSCAAYLYVARVIRSSIWQIEHYDCQSRREFICEVWKKTAKAYKLETTNFRLNDIEGVYKPVAGLLTHSGRQVFRKGHSGFYTYLYHDFHPDTEYRSWHVGDYSIRHARPGNFKARAGSDALYPDKINSGWVNRNNHPVSISFKENNKWTRWSDWACDVTCGQGMRTRRRTCTEGLVGSINCRGSDTEQQPCYTDPCTEIISNNEVRHNGKAYEFKLDKASWSKARQRCRDKRMKLAISIYEDVQRKLIEKIQQIRNDRNVRINYWINAYQVQSVWQLSDGQRIDKNMRLWNAPIEPNGDATKDLCVELSVHGWNDHSCTEARPYICEKDLSSNPCDFNPCQSNRICKEVTNGYTCSCPAGTSGPTCNDPEPTSGGEEDKVSGPCASNPCNSGGKCVSKKDNIGGFVCYCSPDRKGNFCEHDRNVPESFTETATSKNRLSTVTSEFLTRSSAMTSWTRSPPGDACAGDSCNGGGRCSKSDTDPEGFVCFCRTGNLGKRCEIHNACRISGLTGDVKVYKGNQELARNDAISNKEELLLKCSNPDEVVLGVQTITCKGANQWSRSSRILCRKSDSVCTLSGVKQGLFKVFTEDDTQVTKFPIAIESGTFLNFKCERNENQEAFVIECKGGKWQSSIPTRCVSVTCPDVEAPANGEMTVSPSDAVMPFEPSVEISFSCDEFFPRIGSSSTVCQDDGTWSNPVPKCEESGCLLFYFDFNRNVYVKDHKDKDLLAKPGESYKLKCEGYSGIKASIQCMGKDVWKPPIKTITCPEN